MIRTVSPSEHDVLSRLCSVIAVALHSADSYDSARDWYELTRRHAIAEGDDLTIDANLYNVAAYRVHNALIREIKNSVLPDEIERAKWEIESSVNFDAIRHVAAHRWMLPILEIRFKMLSGHYQDSLGALNSWFDAVDASVPPMHQVRARADLALCLAKNGSRDGAAEQIDVALSQVTSDLGDDELALIYFRAFQVYEQLAQPEQASRCFGYCEDRLDRFVQLRRIYLKALAGLQAPAL